jgi:Phage integrase, N-terminal SAM-like domain
MTAVGRFFAWCEQNQIGQLADIEPLHVAAYIEALGQDFEKPTVKQHLAAIRMLFDWLVTGGVLARISHRIRCIGARILRESCCDHGFSQIHRTPQSSTAWRAR